MSSRISRIQQRRPLSISIVVTVLLFLTSAMAQTNDATPACETPRTVVMHDPELDDVNTLTRYLLYSNELDTQGLVYQSGRYHWKGDGEGTPFTGNGPSQHVDYTEGPVTSWRWTEDERFIHDAVDNYAEVYPNLTVHAEGYPDPDELQSRIYEGNVAFPGDISEDTPGSDLIKELLLDDNPCPVCLLTGAGQSTIGRALLSIKEEYQDTTEWQEIYKKVSDKAIISSFGDQDDVYTDYIRPNWPDIEFREMATSTWGYGARGAVLPEDRQYLSAAWTRENVTEVGPFGEFYHVWGDGKQMVPDDPTDFFGFAGLTGEQLEELGYDVWYARFMGGLEEPGSWISEGDTSMFMNLIANGLEGHLDPSYGGWGGRIGEDVNPDTNILDSDYDSARWFGNAQRDFAARMEWSVTPEYSAANHNSTIQVLSPESTTVRPGETVTLTARATDPDEQHLVGQWWQYHEVDTYPGQVELVSAGEEQDTEQEFTFPARATPADTEAIADLIDSEIEVTREFTVPTDVVDGQTLHFIFEATDNGDPNLTAYQRVVLNIER